MSPAPPGNEDLLGVRVGAALIDLALLFGLFVLVSALIGEANVGDGLSFSLDSAAAVVLYLGLVLLYYFVLEATIGQTVGKLLTGVRVVRADGDRPSVGSVAIRTVVRVVDWLPLLYLVGFLTMLATGVRRQRLGDLAARTGIARAAPLRHRSAAAAVVGSMLVLVLAGSVVYVAASDEGTKSCSGQGVSLSDPAVTTDHLDLVAVTAYAAGNPSPCR